MRKRQKPNTAQLRTAQSAAIEQALAHEGRAEVQAPAAAKTGVVAPLWILAALVAAAIAAWVYFS
jgi:hypothetical protein